jgi:hypothetical protein
VLEWWKEWIMDRYIFRGYVGDAPRFLRADFGSGATAVAAEAPLAPVACGACGWPAWGDDSDGSTIFCADCLERSHPGVFDELGDGD